MAFPDANERYLRRYQTFLAEVVNDPVRYARMRVGFTPSHQQKPILEGLVPEGARVTVRSGHGIGKTRVAATAIAWFLETRPFSKVPCTAPTAKTLRDALWPELSRVLRISDDLWRSFGWHPAFFLGNCLTLDAERCYDVSEKREWFAVARTSSKDNPEALQGLHGSDIELDGDGKAAAHEHAKGTILFILDEASGIPDKVFEVAEGALSSHGARLLMLGNMTRRSGVFYNSHFKPGYCEKYTKLHFRSQDSPLVDSTYRDTLVKQFGEDSNVVRVRTDGEPPKQGNDALIAFEYAEAALDREPYDETGEKILGVDPARYGSDRTAYLVRQGRNVLYIETREKQSTVQTAKHAKYLSQKYGCAHIAVDGIGIGAGVVDQLREEGINVVEVTVSESAPKFDDDLQGEQDPATTGEKPRTLRDWLWLRVRDAMETELPSFALADRELAETLAGELTVPSYSLAEKGQFLIVESKTDIKRRGLQSPDIADAYGLTFAPLKGAGGVAISTGNIYSGLPQTSINRPETTI